MTREFSRVKVDAYPPKMVAKKSRAVIRLIEPGNEASCARCGEALKFRAKQRLVQIICNVYKGRRWNRVEYYHPNCYEALGKPYGEPAS
jgi:hypothetical protein